MAKKTNTLKAEKPSEIKLVKAKKKKLRFSFLQTEKFKLTFGAFLVLFSLYLLFSIISYFFYWTVDFDQVFRFELSDLSGKVLIKNWGGYIGAWLSHLLVYKMFGVSSLFSAFLILIAGLRLSINYRMFPFRKSLKVAFLATIWLSLFFGTIFGDSAWGILGGIFGYQLSLWLGNIIGFTGLLILLVFSLFAFLTVQFNFIQSYLNKLAEQRKAKKEAAKMKEANSDKSTSYNLEEYAVNEEESEDFSDDKSEEDEEDEEDLDLNLQLIVKDKNITDSESNELEITETTGEIIENESSDSSEEDELGLSVEVHEEKKVTSIKKHTIDTPYDPTEDLSDYVFPGMDLLKDYGNDKINIYKEELEKNKDRIVETLNNYNIKIQKIKATVGPTVTLYEIVPAAGIRIAKIKNLEDDIALSLSALGIRIIAPIPGKGSIGIEVPNSRPEIVPMKSILLSEAFQNNKYDLPVGIGKTISNESYVFDLAKMPHLLLAGATGQGKSVGLNAVITSLLYKKHPAELKMIMVDPKKVELSLFSKIERHFLAKLPDLEEAIITDTSLVVKTLKSLTVEMDNRYDLLKEAQVRNIKEYNAKFNARRLNPENGHHFMPYIVLIVDEFADLMMTAGKEVEGPITRLAQLARAIGIHLIIATQRPSVNIITGTIKANFPARIAFRVTSKIDSRTILDAGGADQLIGRGDMLMSSGSDVIRLQCAFIDTPEIDDITEFIGSQRAYPTAFLLPECEEEENDFSTSIAADDRDELFEDAARVIVLAQQGSTSLIQRKLKLGYNRAGRIIDQLEAAGIVGQFEGSKAREVKIGSEMALEQFLKDLYAKQQEN
ncbi:MAG: DNA translocase FtsK 4TM domain-containing protein [Bacteroidales bacterium]|nr:DNA translocase FtsK 4TM domain-containing protein [Bacteroidales bacterium]